MMMDGQRMPFDHLLLFFFFFFALAEGLLCPPLPFSLHLKPSRSNSNRTYLMFDQTDPYAKMGHAERKSRAAVFCKSEAETKKGEEKGKKGFAVFFLVSRSRFCSRTLPFSSAKGPSPKSNLGLVCANSLLSFCSLFASRCSDPS